MNRLEYGLRCYRTPSQLIEISIFFEVKNIWEKTLSLIKTNSALIACFPDSYASDLKNKSVRASPSAQYGLIYYSWQLKPSVIYEKPNVVVTNDNQTCRASNWKPHSGPFWKCNFYSS